LTTIAAKTNLYAQVVNPAFAAELAHLGDDRDHRVRRGLVHEIVQLGPRDPQLPGPAVHLTPGDPQQRLVQPGRGMLALGAGSGSARESSRSTPHPARLRPQARVSPDPQLP
jgi:hypothetical protein